MDEKMKLIIDCDPGIDDTLALMYAIKSNKFDILGITTVSGNVPANEGARNVCKILKFLGVNIPVYVGATSHKYVNAKDTHGENGLGNYELPDGDEDLLSGNAINFLCESVRRNYRKITILALGPLTNIALAGNKYHGFYGCVRQIISMGGTFRAPGNCTPVSEYNYWCDPLSAKSVFNNMYNNWAFSNFVMIGLDVTRKIVLTHDYVDCTKNMNPEVGELVDGITRFYFDFHKRQEQLDGCVINDPVAVFYLLDQSKFLTRDYYADVINLIGGSRDKEAVRGMVLVDQNNIYHRSPNVCIATYINSTAFWSSFISTIVK